MSKFGKNGESLYVALIGDIVGSRRIKNRAAVQRRLRGFLEDFNTELADALAAPFKLTAGDEIQGLLSRPEALVDFVSRFADELFPVRMVYGVGRGSLTTEPGPDVASLDGPCFHRARNALASAKKKDAWLLVEGFPAPYDDVISSLIFLIDAIRTGWTKKQAEYSREARTHLQKEVAAKFGVGPSVVSESLKAANFDAVLRGEDTLRTVLSQFGTGTEVQSDSVARPKSDTTNSGVQTE